jgi:predicted nuclease of restriction endonuclease-like (RecB) superfamily
MKENIMPYSNNELLNAVQMIKDAILQSQQRALKSINQEQLALYFGVGRFISQNTRNKNWGSGFIEALSGQLHKELPGLRGFSARNLKNMRIFYEQWKGIEQPISADVTAKLNSNSADATAEMANYTDSLFVTTSKLPEVHFAIEADFPISAFMNIGFSHHIAILSHAKTYEERKFYIQFAADAKITVDDLEKLIDEDLYHHQGNLPNNFQKTIPDQLQAFRTIAMFKDEYLLDYINTEELFVRDKDCNERVIEQGIINNVKNFIMTFGKDFTFVGNQYHLEKFGVEEFPDLLFFNRELSALVCVELKAGSFKTAYLGQLAGYLKILDDEVRKPNENQSIGILLCKSANKKFVEYVIQDYDRPMGVATYKTSADMDERLKKLLPSVEELEKLL